MARPERLELPTYWFVASRSIQTELRARANQSTGVPTIKSTLVDLGGFGRGNPRPVSVAECAASDSQANEGCGDPDLTRQDTWMYTCE